MMLFGYRASLILEDNAGEFEVRDAIRMSSGAYGTGPVLSTERILDAISKRQEAAHNRRPGY